MLDGRGNGHADTARIAEDVIGRALQNGRTSATLSASWRERKAIDATIAEEIQRFQAWLGPRRDDPAYTLSYANRRRTEIARALALKPKLLVLAGEHWEPPAELAAVVGPRLAASLTHTHLLTYRPRDASADALQSLLDSGWSTTGIVTLSQLVSFLNFQLRVVAGLTVLKGEL